MGSGTAAAAMRLRMMASSARRCTADRMAAGVGGTAGAGVPCRKQEGDGHRWATCMLPSRKESFLNNNSASSRVRRRHCDDLQGWSGTARTSGAGGGAGGGPAACVFVCSARSSWPSSVVALRCRDARQGSTRAARAPALVASTARGWWSTSARHTWG